ncbi:MAG: fibrobacter succinogenes major paralogous domain-containing protein [Fibromonadaceae bacterium]|jgi:uncharacterized protein (TIGR02145 family)|nr:fibrobacter succinogenes major paralogous domain-containing protein [Fibromonadaceae bacterium]
MKKAIMLLAIFCIAACMQQKGILIGPESGPFVLTDPRDGKTYKAVRIGSQVWMAENLNYATKGSRCYNDSAFYCDKYGRLYSWKGAMKACPRGWHLPKDEEWHKLAYFEETMFVAGKKLKARSGWVENGNGTDEYGFAALPSGQCFSGNCYDADSLGCWWTATQFANDAIMRSISYENESAFYLDGTKAEFFSVRCIQN